MISENNIEVQWISQSTFQPFMYCNDYIICITYFKTQMEAKSLDMFKMAYSSSPCTFSYLSWCILCRNYIMTCTSWKLRFLINWISMNIEWMCFWNQEVEIKRLNNLIKTEVFVIYTYFTNIGDLRIYALTMYIRIIFGSIFYFLF